MQQILVALAPMLQDVVRTLFCHNLHLIRTCYPPPHRVVYPPQALQQQEQQPAPRVYPQVLLLVLSLDLWWLLRCWWHYSLHAASSPGENDGIEVYPAAFSINPLRHAKLFRVCNKLGQLHRLRMDMKSYPEVG